MKGGETFRFKVPGKNYDEGNHLWIVISNPEMNPEKVAIVNMTSVKPQFMSAVDSACILRPPVHCCVKHTSYILYREARHYTHKELLEWSKNSLLPSEFPVSGELLGRIQGGALISKFSPTWLKALLAAQAAKSKTIPPLAPPSGPSIAASHEPPNS